MIHPSTRKIGVPLIAVLGFLFWSSTAFAYDQSFFASSTNYGEALGTVGESYTYLPDFFGTFRSIEMYARKFSGADNSISVVVFSCDTDTGIDRNTVSGHCTSFWAASTTMAVHSSLLAQYVISTTTAIVFPNTSFYWLQISRPSSSFPYNDVIAVYGSPSATTTDPLLGRVFHTNCTDGQTGTSLTDTYCGVPYFVFSEVQIGSLFPPISGNSTHGVHADCSLVDPSTFGGCIINAFAWGFIPSDTIFDQFGLLKDAIKDHAPFGYFTSAVDAISTFSSSTATSTNIVIPTPIMTHIFTPLRTAMVTILYTAATIWLYKRLTNIVI